MKKILWILIGCFFLGGCGSKPAPEWISASFNQLESYKKNYLRGKERIAELNFRKAIEEIKTSGDIQIMEKAYLTKYAVETAALETFDDREYLRLEALQQTPEYTHFYHFLKGSFAKVDVNGLPPQYRGVFKAFRNGKQGDIDKEVSAIDDPLSRLIAAGLMVQQKQDSEIILNAAIKTASEQGWKKPLLAHLKRLQLLYEAKKEREKASSIRQYIEFMNE